MSLGCSRKTEKVWWKEKLLAWHGSIYEVVEVVVAVDVDVGFSLGIRRFRFPCHEVA